MFVEGRDLKHKIKSSFYIHPDVFNEESTAD